ncbi:alpha/beta hydrolase [Nocardia sp. 004]|uniref:alpha/beta hydrolase n=1 Tax=Nocardia sp. 004 TaxID=3385978 RepID=UPI00399F461F
MPHPIRPIFNARTYKRERKLARTPAALGMKYTDLSLNTSDGETLHGWWMPARGAVGHILFIHGKGANIGSWVPLFGLLVEAGFDVLAFDYRGFGRSTGKPTERGTYRDARAAREALLEQPGIDQEHVLYLGESLGCGVAIELAQEHPPAGLMLMSVFTRIRDVFHSKYPFLPAVLVPDAYPNERRIRTLRVPVLIMHGEQDEFMPVWHAERLYAAANRPKRLVVFPDAGHNDLFIAGGSTWYNLVRDWAGALVRQ